uniref:Prokaryotic-type class I peptide chain release factors domain-containing protein n=1 Tax=Meloidogyne javanica TaxID=6303 RepID=A0A915N642_MELJA
MLQLNNFSTHALSLSSIQILPKDCEEQYIRGWGPGGSCVNSSSNAVLLKHKPTGCFVKMEVDKHLNGENSYSVQFDRIISQIEEKTKKSSQRKRQTMAELKAEGEMIREINREKENNEEEERLNANFVTLKFK